MVDSAKVKRVSPIYFPAKLKTGNPNPPKKNLTAMITTLLHRLHRSSRPNFSRLSPFPSGGACHGIVSIPRNGGPSSRQVEEGNHRWG